MLQQPPINTHSRFLFSCVYSLGLCVSVCFSSYYFTFTIAFSRVIHNVMASKRPATSTTGDMKPKRPRKSLSLEKKLEIVERHEGGERVNSIARIMQLPHSTVSTVIKQADSVKEAGEITSTSMAKTLTRQREPIMEEMERLLRLWIDDLSCRSNSLSTSLVTTQALSIYNDLQKKGYEVKDGSTFSASNGWFDRFKARAALHNIKLIGEAASSDEPATAAFITTLKKYIEECGYSAKQVINYSATGLYWKKMSSRTFIAKEEKTEPGFKASKDRLTLVLGGNAAGDLKLKPFLIYHCENPRALKGYVKEYLPVIYRSNKKALMTSSMNQYYVASYLSPALRDYAAKENIANRFLLLVDNAPSHPTTMEDWADNIEVMFLPKNMTAFIQPMDQGVTTTFKAYYQRCTMSQLINTTDSPDKPTVKQLWANYNIKQAIDNINAAWKEVTEKTMNGCWKKLWPKCVKSTDDLIGFSDVAPTRKDIVRLSHMAGFKEVDEDDVNELLQSHDKPLSNEDLMELEQERALHGSDDDDDDNVPQRGLDIKTLHEVFSCLDAIIEKLKERDPNPARSGTVAYNVEQALKVYRDIFEAKKKKAMQTNISSLFKPAGPSHPAPCPASADPDSPPPPLQSTYAAQDSSSPATSDDEEKASLGF